MNALIVGSLAYDYIMNFSGRFSDRIIEGKIHTLSLSFLVDTLKKQFGGTAGNIAYTSKLLGITPYILSQAGNDFDPYKAFLKKNSIPLTYVTEYDDVSTSSYFVVTDQQNNQIGSFYTGAIQHAELHRVSAVTTRPDMVIIAPTNPKAMSLAVVDCRQLKLPYIYDPAFQIATFSPEELRQGIEGARILIGNDYEIELIQDRLELTHEDLISLVPIVITTLGSQGSIIESRHDQMHIKPANVMSDLDPTGAGDAYRAGFLAGYLRNYPLDVCGRMGSVSAAYTVELYGTQTHTFTKKEFIKRYKDNFGETLSL